MPKDTSKKAIAVVGPTASGKSDIAIALAKEYNGEIISCDSRQIYRHMNIGTGKVPCDHSVARRKSPVACYSEGIPHHCIDIASPNTPYNVAKFKKRADAIIQDILHRGNLPILCGGTGLWAQAVVENMKFPTVLPDIELRKRLRHKSAEELFTELQRLNPDRARTIDSKNKHRLVRAIEISSKTTSDRQPAANNKKRKTRNKEYLPTSIPLSPVAWLVIAVSPPRETLFARIEKRLDERLQTGMIDEVLALHRDKKVSWARLDSFGLEYRHISQYLQSKISSGEMREKLLIDIRHYAKRQLTWLKRWEKLGRKIHWIRAQQETNTLISNFLKK